MKPSVASIIQATAYHFRVSPERLIEPDGPNGVRGREFARPRQVAMYLARTIASTPRETPEMGRQPVSYPALASIFGRDHTTVIHAVRTVPKLAQNDSELGEKIKQIKGEIEARCLGDNSASSLVSPPQLEA